MFARKCFLAFCFAVTLAACAPPPSSRPAANFQRNCEERATDPAAKEAFYGYRGAYKTECIYEIFGETSRGHIAHAAVITSESTDEISDAVSFSIVLDEPWPASYFKIENYQPSGRWDHRQLHAQCTGNRTYLWVTWPDYNSLRNHRVQYRFDDGSAQSATWLASNKAVKVSEAPRAIPILRRIAEAEYFTIRSYGFNRNQIARFFIDPRFKLHLETLAERCGWSL